MDLTKLWNKQQLGKADIREYVVQHAEAGGYVPGDQDLTSDQVDHITNTLYGLYDAVHNGRSLGDYQEGLVMDDLNKAVTHADKDNLVGIKIAVMFLYNVVPRGDWDKLEERAKAQKEGRGIT